MTYITYKKEKGRYSLKAEGHAGYRPGNDIVCAAISALVQTLWAGLMGQCHGRGEKRQEGGYFVFYVDLEKKWKREGEALFDGIVLGLEMIAREHGGYVKITPP